MFRTTFKLIIAASLVASLAGFTGAAEARGVVHGQTGLSRGLNGGSSSGCPTIYECTVGDDGQVHCAWVDPCVLH